MLISKKYISNSFSFTDKQIEYLCNYLNTEQPKNILEYGSGVTTKILDDYIKYNTKSDYISIEHDKNFKLNNHVRIFELIDDLNLNTNMYKGLENYIKSLSKKFDFVIIDGPFGWDLKYDYTRLQMIDPLIFDKLAEEGAMLIHDSQRLSTIKSMELLKILFIFKGYNIHLDYIGYDKDKELTIIKFSKKAIYLRNEDIEIKRMFNKRKKRFFLNKMMNQLKNFICNKIQWKIH